MNGLLRSLLLLTLLLTFALPFPAQLQGAGGGSVRVQEGLGRTWKGPSASVFGGIVKRRAAPVRSSTPSRSARTQNTIRPPASVNLPAITFRPGPDTGIGEMLASAFSSNQTERAVLSELFRRLKQSYETEVAKEGKSNDLAAAMTFFIASNVVAYHNSAMPSDAVTEDFYNSIRGVMAATPEIARMTNAEKQQVHDWLVYMGGFVLAGHMNAKSTNDAASLKDFKAVADQSMRLVLGIGPASFTQNLQSSSIGKLSRRDVPILKQAFLPSLDKEGWIPAFFEGSRRGESFDELLH